MADDKKHYATGGDEQSILEYIKDCKHVLDDPDRFGLAMIVAFIREDNLPIPVGNIFYRQKQLEMSMSKRRIESVLRDWQKNGYAEMAGNGYLPTNKLTSALGKEGVTEEKLNRLADVLYPSA